MHPLLDAFTTIIQNRPKLEQLVGLFANMRHLLDPAAHNANNETDLFGRDLTAMKVVQPLFDFLYDEYWQVESKGARNIPARGPALIVANHSGSLPYDASMIHMAIYRNHPKQRRARFLLEDLVNYLPFVGIFMNRMGGVRACPENAERLLNNDEPVIVFPEGVKGLGKLYEQRYQLARFGRGGVVRLAIRSGSPIIPCAVIGAEEIHPLVWKAKPLAKLFGVPYLPITPTFPLLGPAGLIPLPSKWFILFGKPITYSTDPDLLDDQLQIHELTEQLRTEVQTLINEGLKMRADFKN